MAEPEVIPLLDGAGGPSRRHAILLAAAAIPALVVLATIVELVLRRQAGPLAFFAAVDEVRLTASDHGELWATIAATS
jgi:hypothetical protein